jgi:hypothetical protein
LRRRGIFMNPKNTIVTTAEEYTKPTGRITLTAMTEMPVFDENGNIRNYNKVTGIKEYKNTVVYVGRSIIADLMDPNGGLVPDKISYFVLGDGATAQTPAAETDTVLLNQTHDPIPFDDITSPSNISRVFTTIVPAGTATGISNEFGMKTNSGVLFSRRVIAPVTKDAHIFWIIKWGISF